MMTSPIPSDNKRRPLVHEKISATIFCCDVVAVAFAFILSQITTPYLKPFLEPIEPDYGKNYAPSHDMLFLFLVPFVLYLFYSKGHYTQRIPWWSQVQNILVISIAAFVLDAAIRFALHVFPSRLLVGLSWMYAFLFVLAARQIVYRISTGRGIWRIPTVIIGDRQTVFDVLFAFSNDRYTGYHADIVYIRDKNIRDIDVSLLPKQYVNLKIRQAIQDYRPFIKAHPDHFFVVSLESFRGEERDALIDVLEQTNALYALIPAVSRINSYEMEPKYFFGSDIMLLHNRKTALSALGRPVKKIMDITFSGLTLLLFAPLILMLCILMKAEGQKGSIFYGGERIGYNGSRFRCWKFRTMDENSDHVLQDLLEKDPDARKEWETYRKLKKDPRVSTRTAAFLRKTSLDELPQIWNVFVGDMSLVGPRPVLPDEVEAYGPSFRFYKQVRPGITGLWQVSGRNETSFKRRVIWDSWYVRNWSLWGDFVILFKTLRVVLARHGAY